MELLDTIVAPATPRQISAISIVRLSGLKAREILSRMIRMNIDDFPANSALPMGIYRNRDDRSSIIDRGVVTLFLSPKSYTGEDVVEFSLHGSPAIVDEVIDTCIHYGARMARRGEFTMKAALHGKISLPQAEAIDALIKASSDQARQIALDGVGGKSTKEIEAIRNRLLSAIAEAEYFLEDDISDRSDQSVIADVKSHAYKPVEDILSSIEDSIASAKLGMRITNGIKVAICGEPNVGKSSLLNALVKEDRAIVTAYPGTTRDVIEGDTQIAGISFHFFDTAGIRETDDPVEKIGVERAVKTLRSADIILWVSDTGFNKDSQEYRYLPIDKPVIKVGSKMDLRSVPDSDVEISAIKNMISDLEKKLISTAALEDTHNAIYMTGRDMAYLERIRQYLKSSIQALDEGFIDAFSDGLSASVAAIDEMLGNSHAQSGEDIYQTIFSSFCLGK